MWLGLPNIATIQTELIFTFALALAWKKQLVMCNAAVGNPGLQIFIVTAGCDNNNNIERTQRSLGEHLVHVPVP
jgi:hypothetical protein